MFAENQKRNSTGPYQYKTVYVSIGLFGSAQSGAAKIQIEIENMLLKGGTF